MKKEGACGNHTGGSVRYQSSGLEECVPLQLRLGDDGRAAQLP